MLFFIIVIIIIVGIVWKAGINHTTVLISYKT